MIKFNSTYHDPHRKGIEERIKQIDEESYRVYMLKKLYCLTDREVEKLIEKEEHAQAQIEQSGNTRTLKKK